MNNYIIEGDIDFYNSIKEFSLMNNLLKSKPNNETGTENENDTENFCLISNEKLTEFYVTLPCGHKFNYMPLLKAVLENVKQQSKYKYKNFVKCPYCKKTYEKCLPYNPILEKKRYNKINSPNSLCMNVTKCNYVYKSGKNKGLRCNCDSYYNYCSGHLHKLEVNENTENKLYNIDIKNMLFSELMNFTVYELKKLAKINKKKNYSKLKKKELINLLKS